jgi:hypothetical protein
VAHNKELCDLYSSHSMHLVVPSKEFLMGWACSCSKRKGHDYMMLKLLLWFSELWQHVVL